MNGFVILYKILWAHYKGKEKERVETSQPSSATSNRSGGRKSTGYEYVIPPAALAITSLNNSIKSFEGIIIQSQTFLKG